MGLQGENHSREGRVRGLEYGHLLHNWDLAVERASPEELFRARELLRRLASPDLADADSLASLDELIQLMSVASRNLVLRLVRNGLKALFTPDRSRRMPARWRPRRREIASTAQQLEAALATRDADAAEAAALQLLRAVRKRIRVRSQRPPAKPPSQE